MQIEPKLTCMTLTHFIVTSDSAVYSWQCAPHVACNLRRSCSSRVVQISLSLLSSHSRRHSNSDARCDASSALPTAAPTLASRTLFAGGRGFPRDPVAHRLSASAQQLGLGPACVQPGQHTRHHHRCRCKRLHAVGRTRQWQYHPLQASSASNANASRHL